MKRMISDLTDLVNTPVPGIYIHYDDNNLSTVRALIIGPKDTPYEDGFFFFTLNYPESYPFEHPSAKFETINQTIRFNPNLYEGGKVCLSILGTWQGPAWTPIQTTKSVLLSILSLMGENPINNEPSNKWESAKKTDKIAVDYIEYIRYHKHSFAILEMVRNKKFFPYFNDIVEKYFVDNYERLLKEVETLEKTHNKKNYPTHVWAINVITDYTRVVAQYKKLYDEIMATGKYKSEPENPKTA